MAMHFLVTICVAVLLLGAASAIHGGERLESVSDDDLVQMIKSENYVIVLFSEWSV